MHLEPGATPDGGTRPIPVFVISYERPSYLWACLDSLYRHTEHPCRFILGDSCSRDPEVQRVLRGFERRGMFEHVHRFERNVPDNLGELTRRHLRPDDTYLAYVEPDVVIEPSQPCWLTRFVALMARHPNMALLGSRIDTRDFVDPDLAKRIAPELADDERAHLIKRDSPERGLAGDYTQPIISPFNPPGRLLIARVSSLRALTDIRDDGQIHTGLLDRGYDTGIATGVVHRHLSLLNFFDYPEYSLRQREDHVGAMRSGTPNPFRES